MTDEKLVWDDTLQRPEHWGVQNKQKAATCRITWKCHMENPLEYYMENEGQPIQKGLGKNSYVL